MSNYARLLLLAPAMAIAVVSCRKKDNNAIGDTRIQTLDITSTSSAVHYRFVYDRYNNVDSIVRSGTSNGYLVFSYGSLSYNITDENGLTTQVFYGTNGLITQINVTDTPQYLYKGTQLVQIDNTTATVNYPYISKSSVYYGWTGNDMTAISFSKNPQKYGYTYDKQHIGQISDALKIDQMLTYGRSPFKTDHVPVSLSLNSTVVEQYLYTFDNQNRILTFRLVNNMNGSTADTTLYSYTYR